MLCYLGGAIDLVCDNTRRTWRDEMKKVMKAMGHSTFDPSSAFSVNLNDHDVSKKLIQINRETMITSDIVILVMASNQASIGTPMELFMLVEHNKKAETLENAFKSLHGEESLKPIDFIVVWNPTDSPIRPTDDSMEYRDFLDTNLPAYIGGMTNRVVSSIHDACAYVNARSNGISFDEFISKPMRNSKTNYNIAYSRKPQTPKHYDDDSDTSSFGSETPMT